MRFSGLCLAACFSHALSFSPLQQQRIGIRSSASVLYSMPGFEGEDPNVAALFGAQVPGMPEKPPKAAPIDDDNPTGGQMFKKMMEKAKKGPSRALLDTDYDNPVQPVVPIQQQQPYQQAPQQESVDPYVTYQAQLQAWQQQMTAFAQFSAANPEAAAQLSMPPPPQPPTFPQQQPPQQQQPLSPTMQPSSTDDNEPKTPQDYLPKGDGRNSQAYEVNNAADVYFAQLKRDSTVRTEARKKGDLDVANAPFADKGVHELNKIISEDLLAARREQMAKSGGEFETSRDEMILPSHFMEDEQLDKSYTGVNYKQKLLEAKNKKRGGAAASVKSDSPVADTGASAPPANPTSNVHVPSVKPFTLEATAPQPASNESQTESEPEPLPNFSLPIKDENDIEAIAAPSMEDSEETRKSIRTLMGLLLKHRGGPGFGHGRLQGAEAGKLESMTSEVLTILNNEVGNESANTVQSQPAPAVMTPPAPVIASSAPLGGAIACVDAVVDMYSNADPNTQQELLMPMRDALLSAVNTINKVIVEQELKTVSPSTTNSESQQEISATTMGFPEKYEVSKSQQEEEIKEIVDVIVSGKGMSVENTEALQKTYEALKGIVGDGKYGLRDMSAEEISNAREALMDMRGLIMEELDSVPSQSTLAQTS
mmetsp:Transcript_15630/g.17839  ORF Transcript_15630/g.17839 Transcript_15630/m.17839 type:complete len:652 (+) Transcript_15630:198-2153(+)